MPKTFHQAALAVVISLIAGTSVSCGQRFSKYLSVEEGAETRLPDVAAPASPAVASPVSPISPEQPNPAQLNVYQQAIDRASSAFTLGRSAQSQDDWKLVANRWQQAIELMSAVPKASAQYAQAQKKASEYRSNLTYAQQQANRSTTDFSSSGTVVIHSPTENRTADRPSAQPPSRPVPSVATTVQTPATPAASSATSIFHAPIIRREGNTPVIRVTFNGSQSFDMIVDTGASGTLITEQQAQALGVTPVAAALVDTASQRGVTVPLGYVSSIEVNGAVATNVLVAIAGPQLGTGLLGHDFFGNYDVTIRENEVEFRERG